MAAPRPRPSAPAHSGALPSVSDGASPERPGLPAAYPPGIKAIPPSAELRSRIRRAVDEAAGGLDRSRPLARHEMERAARRVLAELALPDCFTGWTMVALASAFWSDQVAAVPPSRRLLLLPHCLRDVERCPAEFNAVGLVCRNCGACPLGALRTEAESHGYRVLVAEGSPAVMQLILSGHADALLGAACLDVLERTFDKILLAGIPSMAVPLLCNGCRNTSAELDGIRRLISTPYRPAAIETRSYLHLMRAAARLFEPGRLRRWTASRAQGAPGTGPGFGGLEHLDPVAWTEAIARDFLEAGGKHARPFITLAAYDAMRGAPCTRRDGAEHAERLSDAVQAVAMAIEVFHKASLVHDDVEDDDATRYGRPAIHRAFGPAVAINVGDYLIGLGYRLVAAQRDQLGAETTAELLALLADAHVRLSEGQGAELAWRDARRQTLAPIDALRIYALKTAPAFEAAILAGMRMAVRIEPYRATTARFARHLGVAYQMVNDLDDWEAEPAARRDAGTDILGRRPTILWALAMENLDAAERRRLEALRDDPRAEPEKIEAARQCYQRAGVFEQVASLVAKHHQRARDAADSLDHEPLRCLWHFVADAILDRRPLAISESAALGAQRAEETADLHPET